jgi:MFS family permease
MVGLLAPIILLVARIIQGFSVGGEFSIGTTFLVEHAPPGQRGLYGAYQFLSQSIAGFLGGVVGLVVIHGLGPERLTEWGWRIPFLLGLVIGPLGFLLRMTLTETPEFEATKAADRTSPIAHAFAHFKARMLSCFFLTLGGTASFYVLYIVMPTYAVRTLHLGISASFVAPLVGGISQIISAPLGGILADRFGPKRPMLWSVLILGVMVIPAFAWLSSDPSVTRLAIVEFVLAFTLGIYGGSAATAMADLFPVGVRATGLTVGYNVGIIAFGGFAPLVVQWLIEVTKSPLAPAYYDLAGLVCALIAILMLPQPWREPQLHADVAPVGLA